MPTAGRRLVPPATAGACGSAAGCGQADECSGTLARQLPALRRWAGRRGVAPWWPRCVKALVNDQICGCRRRGLNPHTMGV